MINDIEELINNYNLLDKEYNNLIKTKFVDTEESEELFNNMKLQFSSKMLEQILNYVKSNRSCAFPNPNFINQLKNILF